MRFNKVIAVKRIPILAGAGIIGSGLPIPAAPPLTAPAAVTDDTTPTFTWGAVTGAALYELEVATDSGFTSLVIDLTGEDAIAATEYTPTSDMYGGVTYYVRVRGVNAGGTAGAWSTTLTFMIGAGTILYLNTVSGNDANDALTPAAARKTWNSLKTLIGASYSGDATVFVTAPLTAPIVFSFFGDQFVTGDNIYLVSATPGTKWYATGFTRIWTTGWADAGSGIYTRADESGGNYIWYSLLDGDGFYSLLTVNTSTPTTPAAGEFGVNAGTLYVHLTGDANPNSYRLVRPRFTPALFLSGTAKAYIRDMVLWFSTGEGISQDDTPNLTLVDCDVEYHEQNCITNALADDDTVLRCDNVRARKAILNDGFNIKAGTNVLNDCEAAYCGDEGCSPHEVCDVTVTDSRFHHNGQGGFTAVDTAVIHLTRVACDYNGQNPGGAASRGGIVLINGVSGELTNCVVTNNIGEGLYCDTTGEVTVTNLTSADNTEADVLCS